VIPGLRWFLLVPVVPGHLVGRQAPVAQSDLDSPAVPLTLSRRLLLAYPLDPKDQWDPADQWLPFQQDPPAPWDRCPP
jgi:hypothetical protein